MAAPVPPWWWIEAAGASGHGSTAQVSEARPELRKLPLISRFLDDCNRRSRFSDQVHTLLNSLMREGYLQQTDTNVWRTESGGTIAARAPTINDDDSGYFHKHSVWYDSTTSIFYICTDSTIGAADWRGTPLSSSPTTTSGTVRNATGPASFFSWAGAGTATLTAALVAQLANLIFASPDGAAGIPAFRQLKETDLAGFSDVTTANASTAQHGLLLKLSGSSANSLRGDGTWGSASMYTTATTTTGSIAGSAGVYTEIFTLTNAAGIIGSFFLENTGANSMTARYTLTDIDGNSNNNTEAITAGSIVSYSFTVYNSFPVTGAYPPLSSVKLELTSATGTDYKTIRSRV